MGSRGISKNVEVKNMEVLFSNLQSTVVFLVVLSILVVVHEWGHFITAKKLGVNVEKFSLGFGPKLFSRIHDGTEFLVCAIPLGGYVKLTGDVREDCKGNPGEFLSQPVSTRAWIVLNGPVVNFILAYLCFVLVFMLGYPDLSNKVGELIVNYPAQEAGILMDDEIVKVNGQSTMNWTELQSAISLSKGSNINVELMRNGNLTQVNIIPKIEMRKDIFGTVKETRLIGIRPAQDIITLQYGFIDSLRLAYLKLYEIVTMTVKAFYSMLTGSMSAKESMTGPIGIFYVIKTAAEMGFSHLLFIMGLISASLAIINLFPILPLDGGHLFLLGIEKIRGKTLPPKVDNAFAQVGLTLILMLMIFVIYSDVERFGWIDHIKNMLF